MTGDTVSKIDEATAHLALARSAALSGDFKTANDEIAAATDCHVAARMSNLDDFSRKSAADAAADRAAAAAAKAVIQAAS